MRPTDWISLAALFISLATAYFSFFRGAKLQHELGDVLLIRLPSDNKPVLMPELALFNTGARVGVVTKITADIVSITDNRKTNLVWSANAVTEYKAPASPSDNSGTFTRFDSFPHVLFVSKAEAVIKRLVLNGENTYDLTAGDFDLTLTIRTTSKIDHVLTLRRTFRLRTQDIEFLRVNRTSVDRRNLRLNFNPDLNVYLSMLPADIKASIVTAG